MCKIIQRWMRSHSNVCFVSIACCSLKRKKMPGNKSGGCVWQDEFTTSYPGSAPAKNRKKDHFHCIPCGKDLSLFHKGKKDIETHMKRADHQANCKKSAGTKTITQLFSGKIKFKALNSFFFVIA